MKIGKVPSSILSEYVFEQIQNKRKEILLGSAIGEDCSIIKFDSDELCVVSTDPITGATENIGYLGVHVTCNDLASNGAEPIGLLITLLLPPSSDKEQLQEIMQQIEKGAKEVNAQIIGGHTEITDAVTRPILSVTGIGKSLKKNIITSKPKINEDVIMTKWAALEGTAILAKEKEEWLQNYLSKDELKTAQSCIQYLSVLPESKIAVQYGVSAMHDITEGGLLGALWEMAHYGQVGMEINASQIPILPETKKICNLFKIDPLRLISSGSMVITCKKGQELVHKLQSKGIKASIIGQTITNQEIYYKNNHQKLLIGPPDVDELYKVL